MDDNRVWAHEESLWRDRDGTAKAVDQACLMVVPAPPFLLEGQEAINAMAQSPRWDEVTFAHGKIVRPQEGLIVAAYKAIARREDHEDYAAWCTSTYRRAGHDDWRLVQHQQMQVADGPLRSG